jgi:glutaconate CoA-transferase subunit B
LAEVTTLREAVAEMVEDGDSVALEGFTHLIPTAAAHEVIRQERRNLTLIRMTPDLIYDQMIGMGCAEKLIFSWGDNPGVGPLHRFRDAAEHGWPQPLEIEEHSHAGMANRYVAGAKPETLPLAKGDGVLAEHADSVASVPEIFNYWLQAGRVDVDFLGGAQIDRYGNINTTVIGSYDEPKVRLPGAGGAPEIATSAKEVIMVLRQRLRSFVERLDYVTSVGHRRGGDSRAELGYPGAGPATVITRLDVLRPDPETKELTLVAPHPGATVEGAREASDWGLRVAEKVTTTEPPTDEELEVLRELHARTATARARAS